MTDHLPMTDAERGQVNTAAAEVYEAFFVPALFGQFTGAVLDHAGVEAGDSVLDVGCGTGVLARAARRRVGAGGRVAAVDPNDGMIAVARRSDESIDWRPGTAESLPFDDRSHDRTASQFAAMFFTDRERSLDEMARVTRPGGSVTIATWASLDRTAGYEAMVALVAAELGDEAADALRAPFSLGHADQVRGLLASVGGGVRVDEIDGTATFPSIADWVRTDVRGWTLSDLVDADAEAALTSRAERELTAFVSGDGSVVFPAPAILATVTVEH